jgi:hypothetical protein
MTHFMIILGWFKIIILKFWFPEPGIASQSGETRRYSVNRKALTVPIPTGTSSNLPICITSLIVAVNKGCSKSVQRRPGKD